MSDVEVGVDGRPSLGLLKPLVSDIPKQTPAKRVDKYMELAVVHCLKAPTTRRPF